MFTLNDLFDIAAKMEKNGRAIYSRALKETQDKTLAGLLKWMADEEERHCNWFLNQKKHLNPDKEDLEVVLPDVLQEMMGENSLSLDDVDFSTITSSQQMLSTFIRFEKDTVLFYQFLGSFLESDTALQGLEKIIDEEKAHVAQLTTMLGGYDPD